MRRCLGISYILVVICAGCSQDAGVPRPVQPLPSLAPNAPKDKPFESVGSKEIAEYQEAIAPYVEKARRSYPAAKKRFLDGLPPRHTFYVVTRLRDRGAVEQVFIAVSEIKDGRVKGIIATDVSGVSGYRRGDSHSAPEDELIDWLISRPDGTEEGNVVGKFLDEWQQSHRQ